MKDKEQMRKSAACTPRRYMTPVGDATIVAHAFWRPNTDPKDCRCTPRSSGKVICPQCRWRIKAEALTELGELAFITAPDGDHHFPVFGLAMPPKQEALRDAVRHVFGLALDNLPNVVAVQKKL